MIKKVAFVSFRSTDVEGDKRFWGELLGLKLAQNFGEGKWIEFDAPDGKTIAIEQFSPEGTPTTLALETDDIEAEVAKLKEAGVPFQGGIMDNKVCKMAFAKTPSGHTVMLHQMAPERVKGPN
ncbi:MAG: VOC family protein [Planctomycetota bacterium]